MSTINTTPVQLIDQVANNFMTLTVSIGMWKGVTMNRTAAKRAAENDGVHVDDKAARLYVDMLGSNQSHLKAVQQKYTKVRTYVYEVTQSTASGANDRQKRGDLLLPTARVADVYATLNRLTAEAEAERDAFLAQYENFVARAKGELAKWADEMVRGYPTVEQVRNAFYIKVSPPRPLTPVNVNALRKANIPTELAEQLAQQSVNEVTAQLEAAKQNTLDAAIEHLDVVVKQLNGGKRLHQSLITHAQNHGQFLRELGQALGDVRIEEVAKKIEQQVANVRTTEQWKDNYTRRASAAKAATEAVKVLRDLNGPSVIEPESATSTGGDDLLPDLF